jgi:hypothetical protein
MLYFNLCLPSCIIIQVVSRDWNQGGTMTLQIIYSVIQCLFSPHFYFGFHRRWSPPAAESSKSYKDDYGSTRFTLHNPDSPITIYIQHPILIPAPGEEQGCVMLTKKVRFYFLVFFSRFALTDYNFVCVSKGRRGNKGGKLQNKWDRIRMGMVRSYSIYWEGEGKTKWIDPPVRLANLMCTRRMRCKSGGACVARSCET